MSVEQTLKILIAEDEFFISKEIEKLVQSMGHQVIGIAGDGEKACRMNEELQPDLILMDITMPKMNGLEAIKQIHENEPTAIIVLTAHESMEMLQEAATLGVGPSADPLAEVTMAAARNSGTSYLRSRQSTQNVARKRTNAFRSTRRGPYNGG